MRLVLVDSTVLISYHMSGTFVAFNCYLASMPAAFARAPLDGSSVPVLVSVHCSDAPQRCTESFLYLQVCSQAIMVETSFVSPGPELNETKTAEGFDRTPGMRDAGVPKEICGFFQKSGWCRYGDSCKHAHLPVAPALPPPLFAQRPPPSLGPCPGMAPMPMGPMY